MNLKKSLLQAIESAKDYKACKYLSENGEPRCVIAQLFVLSGGNKSDMKDWEWHDGNSKTVDDVIETNEHPELINYNINLLKKLQNSWDLGHESDEDGKPFIYKDEEQAKNKMKEIVASYYD